MAPTNGAATSRNRTRPASRLLAAAAAAVLLQVLAFGSFHLRSSDAAQRVQSSLALGKQLTAVLEDSARLHSEVKHLENRLAAATADFSSRGLVSDAVRKELQQPVLEEPRQGAVFPAGNEHRGCTARAAAPGGAVAAVAMVAFNRPTYLRRSLESLLGAHHRDPSFRDKFPLYVSQDGTHPGVRSLVLGLAPRVRYLNHIEDAPPKPARRGESLAYYRIANHYKFIMQQLFDCMHYERAILVEDDMQFAPDFFPFFEATAKILDQDKSLWCVSSWNDHGQHSFVSDPERIVRTDFFPGLGWMLRRDTWDSLAGQWPSSFWDDAMRTPELRRGRQCLRPEICRTYNFGELGSSKGQFYYRFLLPIRLNDADVPWGKKDLSYLLRDTYDAAFNETLAAARTLRTLDELPDAQGDVKVVYETQLEYELITGRLRMLREWKAGIPRGSYKRIVQISWNKGRARLFIAPAPSFRFVEPEGKVVIDSSGAVRKVIQSSVYDYTPAPGSGAGSSQGSGSWFWWHKKRAPPPPRGAVLDQRLGGSGLRGSGWEDWDTVGEGFWDDSRTLDSLADLDYQ